MLTHYAIEVTRENTPAIIEHLAQYNLNVADDVDSIIDFYAPTGEKPYAIVHVSTIGRKEYYKFYVIGSKSFDRIYRISGDKKFGPLTQIETIL